MGTEARSDPIIPPLSHSGFAQKSKAIGNPLLIRFARRGLPLAFTQFVTLCAKPHISLIPLDFPHLAALSCRLLN